ncbi:MAG: DUF4136 domain-containing protein [bacterium]
MILIFAVMLTITGGCGKSDEVKRIMESPISFDSYVSPWADFARYRTWNWIEPSKNRDDTTHDIDPAVRQAIRDAITRQMEIRGYEKVTRFPDIVLNYHVAVASIDEDYIEKMYDGSYYPAYRMDFSGPRSARHRWDEGTLIVVGFDTYTKKLIWEGTAVAEVTSAAPLDERIARIDKAAKWMFTSLPGRPPWDDNILRDEQDVKGNK